MSSSVLAIEVHPSVRSCWIVTVTSSVVLDPDRRRDACENCVHFEYGKREHRFVSVNIYSLNRKIRPDRPTPDVGDDVAQRASDKSTGESVTAKSSLSRKRLGPDSHPKLAGPVDITCSFQRGNDTHPRNPTHEQEWRPVAY